jgi:hypothetical protein
MTSDQIMQVLRLTAMGRINHPDQVEFCEKVAKLLAEPEYVDGDKGSMNLGIGAAALEQAASRARKPKGK